MTESTESPEATAVDALSYEQARDELGGIVARLEQGGATLEESLALWERGNALAERCEQWLVGAKTRLDAALSHGADGDAASSDDESVSAE